MDDSNIVFLWLYPLIFAGLWLLIFFIAARWGGWRAMAAAYPSHGVAAHAPPGTRLRMRSAQFRAGCNYNNCVTFVASEAGLHLSLPLPFRFQHPAIFLPWSELRVTRDTNWLGPIVILTPARTPDLPIRLLAKLGAKLLPDSLQPMPSE